MPSSPGLACAACDTGAATCDQAAGPHMPATATEAELPTFESAAKRVLASVKIAQPQKPKQPKVSTKGYWGKQLAGKRIVRFFHGSGYSETQQILMCPDGYFVYRFESGGSDIASGWSGASQSKNGGRWSVSGDANGGVLKLTYNDGRVADYNLVEQGSKLMVDGKRWLREAINCP